MSVHRLIVYTEPVAGREDEYNKWYNEAHLKEVLEVEGFVAAQRFELADAQLAGPDDGAKPGRFLAIYEIEAPNLQAALDNLMASSGKMNMSDALDQGAAGAVAYSAICDRMVSA